MSEDTPGKSFSCDRCGQKFAWKAHLVGKKMRCKCGSVFVAGAPPHVQSEEYDIGDEPVNPPPVEMAPVQTISSKVLEYRRAPRQAEVEVETPGSAFKNLYLPGALFAIGLGVRAAQLAVPGASSQGMLATAGLILLGTVLNVALTLAALFVAASFLGTNFGPVNQAAVKAAATSIIVGAAASVVVNLDKGKGLQGPVIALHVTVILYWILFAMFFELDVQETLVTVVIVSFFQMAAMCVVLNAVR
jgi:hypothetical protein